jgi:hypothetical protein
MGVWKLNLALWGSYLYPFIHGDEIKKKLVRSYLSTGLVARDKVRDNHLRSSFGRHSAAVRTDVIKIAKNIIFILKKSVLNHRHRAVENPCVGGSNPPLPITLRPFK